MLKTFFFAILVFGANAPWAVAQIENFTPVTREMLLNPPPGDWLMFSRTYDNQRFSPLNQINRQNVAEASPHSAIARVSSKIQMACPCVPSTRSFSRGCISMSS